LRDDVRALFDHNSERILGRNKSGTLRLSVDGVGLKYEIDLPDTQTGRDIKTSVVRGDITGSSFAFSLRDEEGATIRYTDAGVAIREIRSVKLYDVGPVTYPAYDATEAAVRSTNVKAMLERLELDKQQEASENQEAVDACRAYAYDKTLNLRL
jgi:HK97 family phage prohead protease